MNFLQHIVASFVLIGNFIVASLNVSFSLIFKPKKKLNKTMLDYVKLILEKVSFDQSLFEKELKKSIRDLIHDDLLELKKWCYENFGNKHNQVLDRCFS